VGFIEPQVEKKDESAHHHQRFNKSIGFWTRESARERVRLACQSHAPVKLQNAPTIITTAINLEKIVRINMMH
jgi:hypothetical protein